MKFEALTRLLKIKAVLNWDVIRISFAVPLKFVCPLIDIALLTDRTPFVYHAALVIFNFSSGSLTFPDKNIFPSKTFTLINNRYFFSVNANLVTKFFCIIESSICVPSDRGSNATLTPVPKTPLDPVPPQLLRINKVRKITINLFYEKGNLLKITTN